MFVWISKTQQLSNVEMEHWSTYFIWSYHFLFCYKSPFYSDWNLSFPPNIVSSQNDSYIYWNYIISYLKLFEHFSLFWIILQLFTMIVFPKKLLCSSHHEMIMWLIELVLKLWDFTILNVLLFQELVKWNGKCNYYKTVCIIYTFDSPTESVLYCSPC
jgi:hypothetical protein